MRFSKKKGSSEIMEADLTPMIDMTFQLIAFFMIVINFSDADRAEEIQLPASAIAKPPEEIEEYKIILNLDEKGGVIFDGQRIADVDLINPIFNREITAAQRQKKQPEDIIVIIRGHQDAETGMVQRLINKCQENKLVNFRLRVKEQK